MSTATMTTKGQMTLPKDVRDDLGLKPGDKVEIVKQDGRYVLMPRNIPASALAGLLGKSPAGAMTIEQEDTALRMRWPKKTSAFVLAVDTNVLVRFFADDDDLQSVQAKQFITQTADRRIYLSMLVLAETFTVLTKVRKFPSTAVHEAYRMLLRSPTFTVENPQLVAGAIETGESTKCGFTDALIALQNQAAGCSTTATFDHRASRLDGMQRVEDLL